MTMKSDRSAEIDKYYYYLNMITENVRNGYDDIVLKYCGLSLPLIPVLIEETTKSTGEFDITTLPAIELGAKLWGRQGNEQRVRELDRLVSALPELSPWKIHIERAYEYLRDYGE